MISTISGVTDITKTLLSGKNIAIDIQTVRPNNLCCYQVSLISLSLITSLSARKMGGRLSSSLLMKEM